jgi:DNA polymerase-3 subunit delta
MVITVTGTNSYLLQQALQQLVTNFVTEHTDMGLERLEGDEVSAERISEALTSLPFLTAQKLIILRQGSANKVFTEQAANLLTTVPDTTDVIVVEPKLDKRSAYYKFLKSKTDYREYNELDPHGLARWLVQTAKERGGSLNQADASFLVSRVGANQRLLANELEKLLLFSANIDRSSIISLTEATPQSTVFELLEAAFNDRPKQALLLYAEQRALKVEPQQIVAMLSWQLHILALIKTAGQRSPEQIASEAKVSPYVIKKSIVIARKLPLSKLKHLITDLAVLDGRSKRETFNIDDALQHFLLTI